MLRDSDNAYGTNGKSTSWLRSSLATVELRIDVERICRRYDFEDLGGSDHIGDLQEMIETA